MGISNRERDEDVDEIRRVLGIGKCVVVLRFLFNLIFIFFILHLLLLIWNLFICQWCEVEFFISIEMV